MRKIFLIVTAIFMSVLLFRQFYSVYPLMNPEHGFIYYAPTKLPTGFTVTQKRVAVIKTNSKTLGVYAELNLRTEDWVYEINESKRISQETTTSLTNYDPKSVGVTCKQQASLKAQKYRLCHWIDYGRISVFEVKLNINDTHISSTFPADINRVVSDSELMEYVDSFRKSNTAGWPVLSGVL